ncbi:hypothetical protein [Fusibacter bizertensis]
MDLFVKKKRFYKGEKGSVSIEATIAFPIMMIILITLFGTLISFYIDERVSWSVLNTRDEMSLYSMPFMGHDKIIEAFINTTAISELSEVILKRHIREKGIENLVQINDVQITFDAYGFAKLEINYNYKLLSLNKVQHIYLPLSASAVSDGESIVEPMVYITTYGEKYHKASCFHLRKSKFGISLSKAEEKGYEACKNCYSFTELEQ